MNFRCIGLPRGGHHIVMYWLMYQTEKIKVFKEPIQQPKVDNHIVKYENYTAVLYDTQNAKLAQPINMYNEDMYVIGYEGGTVASAFSHPVENLKHNIIILRDIKNVIASAFKKLGSVPDSFVDLWYNRAREIVNKNGYFINYNIFNNDPDYRKHICHDFGIHFTDIGIDYIPPQAGGSSFSHRQVKSFRREELNMRYKMINQSIINNNLKDYPQFGLKRQDLLDLDQEIFGEV